MKTITVIQPTKTENKLLRVAAYCRVSSSSEDQLHSYKAQNSYYRALIASNDDWKLADIYADEGITGTSAEMRNDFQRLMNDCRKGKIDLVLVKSISRFARNTMECLEALRELKKLNIVVRFEKEGIDTSKCSNETIITIMSAIAQEESVSISQNMRWSYQKRMQSGEYITTYAPLGYDMSDGKLVINPEEADMVKQIFQMFLRGMGMNMICEALNGRLSMWGVHYVLTNEKYMGDALVQKSYTTETLPFIRKTNRGEVDQYYIYDTQEPIINRTDFYRVQAILNERRNTFYYPKGNPAWGDGKIVCGICGKTYHRTVVREKAYWVCRTHFKKAALCAAKRIPEKALQQAFLKVCNKLKYGMKHVLEPMLCQLTEIREQSADLQSLECLKKEELSLKEQSRLLADLQVKGHIDSALYAARKQKISQKLEEIRSRTLKAQANDDIDESISSTSMLIDTINSMPDSVTQFDEDLFRAVVINITVNDDTLSFRLINGMVVTEKIHLKERTKK